MGTAVLSTSSTWKSWYNLEELKCARSGPGRRGDGRFVEGFFFGSAPLCLLLLLLVLLALLLFLFLGFLGSTLRLVTNAFLLLSVSLFDPSVHLGFRPCPLLGQQSHFLVGVHFQSLFDLRLRWLRM